VTGADEPLPPHLVAKLDQTQATGQELLTDVMAALYVALLCAHAAGDAADDAPHRVPALNEAGRRHARHAGNRMLEVMQQSPAAAGYAVRKLVEREFDRDLADLGGDWRLLAAKMELLTEIEDIG
jgi:hypothetical protein